MSLPFGLLTEVAFSILVCRVGGAPHPWVAGFSQGCPHMAQAPAACPVANMYLGSPDCVATDLVFNLWVEFPAP